MNIFITFWNGDYVQFDECDSIDYTLGLVRIFENNELYEYEELLLRNSCLDSCNV